MRTEVKSQCPTGDGRLERMADKTGKGKKAGTWEVYPEGDLPGQGDGVDRFYDRKRTASGRRNHFLQWLKKGVLET